MEANDLPRIGHKSDTESLSQLRALGYPAVAPVLPLLLEWIQDMNWPIARPVSEFLASIGRPVLPEIRKVFLGDDDIWKLSCLCILRDMHSSIVVALQPEINRMANDPTPGEKEEGVSEEAQMLLLNIDSSNEK